MLKSAGYSWEHSVSPEEKKTLLGIIRSNSHSMCPIETDCSPRLQNTKQYKGILFDIYGTLFISSSGDIGTISEHQHASALKEVFLSQGISLSCNSSFEQLSSTFKQLISEEHARKNNLGITHPEVDIREIWESFLVYLQRENCISEFRKTEIPVLAVELETRMNKVWPMPGLTELGDFLRSKQIITGIISNAQFYTPLLFEAFLDMSIPDFGFNPDIVEFSFLRSVSKPSPALAEPILHTLKTQYAINPEEMIYVGNDMRNDISMAHSCGMSTCLFAGDKRSLRLREDTPKISTIKPDIVITDLRQLTSIV